MAGVRAGVFWLHQQPYILLALTALFWAGNAVAGKLAVGEISPFVLTLFRWILVAVAMSILFGRDLIRHWTTIYRYRLQIIAMAALGFTGFNTLFYLAAHQTSAVNIGILQGSIPIIVLIGAVLVYRTRITTLQTLGAIITFSGVVFVATKGQPHQLLGLAINPGDATMLLACLLYSGYTIALKRRPPLPAMVFFTLLAIVAAIASLPMVLVEVARGMAEWPTSQGWLVTLFVSIMPSCLAQIFFIRGVELIGPERAGLFVNLVPVFAALLAVAILGETFHFYHTIALSLVLAGIGLAEFSRARP